MLLGRLYLDNLHTQRRTVSASEVPGIDRFEGSTEASIPSARAKTPFTPILEQAPVP